ncbi:DUF1572 family protein [Meridianimaribacter flavus]|uniref:Uncharacterized protein DUF1572 n=1 Tax=Meridianimaribacter flavus TaxID=571115 RepID=A0ABY2G4M3_9FLAO|nr:DUF1572 family protein [Meridianimaribacter flavus]TDY11232.1 uncharacterized protein DUF1572 [Meridianimaribacter flavus]
MENTIISGIIKQFEYYKTAADKTFDQLSFDDMNWQPNDTSNSISIIVKHMVGNMLSRWTNFLTEDGEKDWRHREQEFVATYTTKNDVLQAWEKGWNCLFDAIQPLKDSDLERIVYIRNEKHTVAEAIFRQLGHYPYHIGQIAYIGKLLKENHWKSLSIPKGQSEAFNKEKFNKNRN